MPFVFVCLELRCSCFASHAHTVIPVLWNIDKFGSIVERYWQSKVEVLRLHLRPYQENTELTPKIQELHALVCASCYTQYELLVLQNQLGPDSLHINYQQLKSPLRSLSQEEMITGD